MMQLVTTAATVLGSLLGFAQSGYWCEWFRHLCEYYWAGRQQADWDASQSRSESAGESHDQQSYHDR